ncbi:MAG TPA: hypothetical protein VHQ70_07055, partial [Syntrophomonadaceae bacterium]|nr:hypothetical protein [Syntrophomonadaceae bacterium]
MSATTLTAMGMSYGIYHDINKSVNLHNPFSYVYWSNPDRDHKVNQVLARYPQNRLLHAVDISFISAHGRVPGANAQFALISESNYNEIAQIKGWDKVNISKPGDAAIIHSDYDFKGQFLHKKVSLRFEDKSRQEFNVTARREYKLTNNTNTWTTLVLKDEAYDRLAKVQKPNLLRALVVDNQKDCKALNTELGQILPQYGWNSYYSEYIRNMEERGILMFVGGFLGLVILFATGSIIYFRQLNDAQKEAINY